MTLILEDHKNGTFGNYQIAGMAVGVVPGLSSRNDGKYKDTHMGGFHKLEAPK